MLKSKIIDIMKRFDVIFDLHKLNEDYTLSTKYVSGPDRQFVRKTLTEIYDENNFFNRKKYTLDHHSKYSFDTIAGEIADEILKIRKMKNIATEAQQ
jgi:hypothetical protein